MKTALFLLGQKPHNNKQTRPTILFGPEACNSLPTTSLVSKAAQLLHQRFANSQTNTPQREQLFLVRIQGEAVSASRDSIDYTDVNASLPVLENKALDVPQATANTI